MNNNITIAHHNKLILKVTTPINFQFIEKGQQKSYMIANKLVENLGYIKKPTRSLKLISTQDHIKSLQQLTPSKASHNKNVTFNIPETHHTKSSKDNETLTESHLIFSVLNCTSFKESFSRSINSDNTL